MSRGGKFRSRSGRWTGTRILVGARRSRSGLGSSAGRMRCGGASLAECTGRAPAREAKAAARRLAAAAKADADRALAHEAVDRLPDPWEALGRLAVEANAMKEALGARVNALEGALRYTAPGAGTEQLRAEVALYERAMDRSAKFADLLLATTGRGSGLSWRRVRRAGDGGIGGGVGSVAARAGTAGACGGCLPGSGAIADGAGSDRWCGVSSRDRRTASAP